MFKIGLTIGVIIELAQALYQNQDLIKEFGGVFIFIIVLELLGKLNFN